MIIDASSASLIFALAIAACGVIATWAVLRATVSDLKRDVASMRDLVLVVQLVKATQETHGMEIERIRSWSHDTRNRLQDHGERLAAMEARADSQPPTANGYDR